MPGLASLGRPVLLPLNADAARISATGPTSAAFRNDTPTMSLVRGWADGWQVDHIVALCAGRLATWPPAPKLVISLRTSTWRTGGLIPVASKAFEAPRGRASRWSALSLPIARVFGHIARLNAEAIDIMHHSNVSSWQSSSSCFAGTQ